MNERIKERIKQLADKAGQLQLATPDNPSADVIMVLIGPNIEKFAELIVKECSRVIVNGGYWSGGPIGPKRQCTPPEIAQMIREHFGVEE